MQTAQPWMGSWPPSPLVMLAGVLVAMVFMYLGRYAAHAAFRALSAALQRAFLELAEAVMSAQRRLVERNREVLLEMGRESTERMIEREFERVNDVVARDLGAYPELHREISHQITRIDEDYRASDRRAASLRPSGHSAVRGGRGDSVERRSRSRARSWATSSKTLCSEKTQHRAIERVPAGQSRSATGCCSRMLPFWRQVSTSTLDQGRYGTILRTRGAVVDVIDHQMEALRGDPAPAVGSSPFGVFSRRPR